MKKNSKSNLTTQSRFFSENQKNAICSFDKDVVIFAGAGSGKTTLLVERFLYAVTQMRVLPEEILAITFTEKAANEMKSRLFAECEKRHLPGLESSLERAFIGTIHGFCAQLLKENPIESGIDPNFLVLSAIEAKVLAQEILSELFEEKSADAAWIEILASYGEDAVRAALLEFYELYRMIPDNKNFLEPKNYESLKKVSRQNLIATLGNFCDSPALDQAAESASKDQIRQALTSLTELLGQEKIETRRLFEGLAASKEKLSRKIPNLKDLVDNLHNKINDYQMFLASDLSKPIKEKFSEIFFVFKDKYEEAKNKKSVYDFDDLLVKAYHLISRQTVVNRAIRERYQKLFKYIFVDEYQDTSPLQTQIINSLKTPNNLFVVGDLQQSIYGFRHANPEVFLELASIAKTPQSLINIQLKENYRSRKEILFFINHVFSKLFASQFHIPLLPIRPDSPDTQPRIEIMAFVKEKDQIQTLQMARVLEARALAQRIRSLADKGVCYKDIAILFRSVTASLFYERELKDFSIPFRTSKGQGFYEKEEVLDLVNFLTVLESPNQDIPLASTLRSPLVGISDDALFWLAKLAKSGDRENPLFSAIKNIHLLKEISLEDKARLQKFYELYLFFREYKDYFKVSEILTQIVEKTLFDTKILTQENSLQKLANVRKLIQSARSLEEKNIMSLGRFIQFLRVMSEEEVMEPQAREEMPNQDLVTLSTVHAAKGLEFSYVFIVDMGSGKQDDDKISFSYSKNDGFGIRLKGFDGVDAYQDFSFHKTTEYKKTRESAEDKRVLYVAMTRAKDHLVLSGFVKSDDKNGCLKNEETWLSAVLGAMDISDVSRNSQIDFADSKVQIDFIREIPESFKLSKAPQANFCLAKEPVIQECLERFEPISEKLATNLELGWDESIAQAVQNQTKDFLKPYDHWQDLTVSDVLESLGEKSNKKAKVLIDQDKDILDEETLLPANEYGSVFHKAMELSALQMTKKNRKSFYFLDSLTKRMNKRQAQSLRQGVSNFWKSSWGKVVRGAEYVYPELPFIYKTEHGILKGQIDLVFKTKEGEWVILDYKTNQISSADKEEVACGYQAQLILYAFVFYQIHGQLPKRGILYFSAINDFYELPYSKDKTTWDAQNLIRDYFLEIKN